MKNKLIQLTKLGILLLGISLSLTNCQKDEIEIQETDSQAKEFNYGNISFSEFANRFDLGTIDQNVSSKFNTNLFFQENMYTYESFSTNDGSVDYTIETGVVKTASFDGTTTYSMKVITDDPQPNTITNIFFEESADGNIAYILEFTRDAQTLEYLSVKKFDTEYNEIYSAPVVSNYDGSIIFLDVVYFDCPAGHSPSCTIDCGNCYSSQQFIVWNDSPNTDSSSGDSGSGAPGGDGGGSSNTGSGSSGYILGDHPYLSSDSSTAIGIVDNDTTVDVDIQNAQAFYATLNSDQRAWANSNQLRYINLVDYLLESFTSERQEIFRKIIDYLRWYPNTSWTLIEDWFLNTPNYTELNLNLDPNNITYSEPLTQQSLPTLDNFVNNFPKLGTSGNYYEMPTSQVYQLVGGSLLTSHQNNPSAYSNACSIRGSRGLLYSGIDIPILNYPGVGQRTQKGGDNENYILDAVSFDKFMRDKFGNATYELTGTDANDPVKVANLLNGKNGIYVIINNSHAQAGYSGHVDAIINGDCISNAYTTPSGGVKSIRIWELN